MGGLRVWGGFRLLIKEEVGATQFSGILASIGPFNLLYTCNGAAISGDARKGLNSRGWRNDAHRIFQD